MKRDQLLILISVIFLSVSAYILYTAFFATPGSVAVLTIPNVDQDKTNLLNVRALDKQIEGSIKNLGPNGSWDQLGSSSQYQQLTPEANIGVQIGVYGQRENPFLQIHYSTSTNGE
jgi:hypothetical protein